MSFCESVSANSDFNKLSEASFSEARITNVVEYLCSSDEFIKKIVAIFGYRGDASWLNELMSKASIIIKALDSWITDLESFLKNNSVLENVSNEKNCKVSK